MPEYCATPVIELKTEETERFGIRLLVKREDLNHPSVSGNKWWKLKYNIAQAVSNGLGTVLTFGGAYSNHIYATAAYANEVGLKSVGIIRGEKTLPLNPTLSFAENRGMKLHYVDRETYRKKHSTEFLQDLEKQFGAFYLIPEGGTNNLAVRGCAEFAKTHLSQIEFDYLCLPVGTGGTMAGMIIGFEGSKRIIGIPVLKNGEFLHRDIEALQENYSGNYYGNWELLPSYHHGGYAKATEDLKRFIVSMYVQHNLPLDHVYTAKLLWAVFKEISLAKFERGSTVLVLHTGGLQGSLSQQHDDRSN
jgi:1-aminocyclopropane-1-carboxylate deaminase